MFASYSQLGVRGTLNDFLNAANKMGESIEIDSEFETFDDMLPDIGPTTSLEVIGAKEWNNDLFIYGISSALSTSLDFVVDLSKELNTIVVSGCVVEGAYYSFYAASEGRIIRVFRFCPIDRTTKIFEKGQPISSEGIIPLTQANGEGIVLAINSFGFDFESSIKEGPFKTLVFSYKKSNKKEGLLDKEIREFDEKIEKEGENVSPMRIVVKKAPEKKD